MNVLSGHLNINDKVDISVSLILNNVQDGLKCIRAPYHVNKLSNNTIHFAMNINFILVMS